MVSLSFNYKVARHPDEAEVAAQISESEWRQAALFLPKQLSGAAHAQVSLGNLKSISRLHQDF